MNEQEMALRFMAELAQKNGRVFATLQIVEEVAHNHGIYEGYRACAQTILLGLIEDRFGPVPDAWVQRIEDNDDPKLLLSAARQVFRVHKLDDVYLPVSNRYLRRGQAAPDPSPAVVVEGPRSAG